MAETGILKEILSTKEVSELLGLSTHSVYRMIHDNVIPFSSFGRNGRTKRFNRKKIMEWIQARSTEGKT